MADMFSLLLVVSFVVLFLAAIGYLIWPRKKSVNFKKFQKKYTQEKMGEKEYDVIVVGAGPAGSCLSYFLSKQGRKVLLLEKKVFPRDKYCGDAVCKTGIEILHEMGLLQELISSNKARVADCGGLCSPGGLTYVGHTKEIMGTIPAAIACKRILLDETLVRAAQREGVQLLDGSPVKNAKFHVDIGLWTVLLENSEDTFKGRVLVCADGAPSKLANQLGLVTKPPQGSCSRAYIEPGTHNFNADGVVFYHKDMLPGYSALFRHPNNELNYCVYIIPGNPRVTNETLPHWHEYLLKNDENISKSLGKSPKLERMKVGSLRFGGKEKTYGNHVLVAGDAAGFIDPMTGEGIHTAMLSGKIAAEVLKEAFDIGNFDEALLKEYHYRCFHAFGRDFYWSMKICQLLYRYPILLDAATAAIIRKGDHFFARWADIMTGRTPKFHLLHPEIIIVMAFEVLALLIKKFIGKGRRKKQD